MANEEQKTKVKVKTGNAIKRDGQSLHRRKRNRSAKHAVSSVRTQLLEAVEAGNKDAALKLYAAYSSELDKAAKNGILKANNASRKKSRLAARLKAMTSP